MACSISIITSSVGLLNRIIWGQAFNDYITLTPLFIKLEDGTCKTAQSDYIIHDPIKRLIINNYFKISEVDCVVFGFMVLAKYAPITKVDMLAEHQNIVEYVERIKNEFYPDWNQLIQK